MRSTQVNQIQFGNTVIPYEIFRSPLRTNISVSVHPSGAVTVEAPKGTRKTQITEAVQSKKVWILNQQEHFRRLMKARTKQFVSGETFLYLGRQYKLIVLDELNGDLPAVRLFRGQLEVRASANPAHKSQNNVIQKQLIKWYREKAINRLGALTTRYAGNVGVKVESVRVLEMKRRWGSTSNTGRISYNWKIILARKRLIEYVVAHEVCHLKYNDHSKLFWRLLERTMPDYERRRVELTISGSKYDFTACAGD